ncbi:MAG: hypothetical protein BGO82_07880 [Devosia sp. 67-54]|nr:MAG: hypothetical protein BGO82_07880 [Devosia sp. 67-54]
MQSGASGGALAEGVGWLDGAVDADAALGALRFAFSIISRASQSAWDLRPAAMQSFASARAGASGFAMDAGPGIAGGTFSLLFSAACRASQSA